ncbi:MAG: 50S ribosomal protein bL37 [Acidimicrobiales bacterium]
MTSPYSAPNLELSPTLPNVHSGVAKKRQRGSHYTVPLVSKRTVKRKLRKKKKANHGKKPNCGRG